MLQQATLQLISENEPTSLLRFITEKGVELLECDAGTLYLKLDTKKAKFAVVVNHSLSVPFEPQTVSIQGTGLAAYVFQTGKEIRVSDVYDLPAKSPYRFYSEFDKQSGYRTRSVLATPLKNSRGELIGVLQLINRKKNFKDKWPSHNLSELKEMPDFTEEDSLFVQSFAAVASASLEKNILIENIEQLFKGFIKASVQVIESRDPATRGHSERVAILSCELASKINQSDEAELKDIKFTERQLEELKYAALLHDFGKVSVKESILLKANKLYEIEELRIRNRIDRFWHAAETGVYRAYLKELVASGSVPDSLSLARIDKKAQSHKAEFDRIWSQIVELNQPRVLNQEQGTALQDLIGLQFVLPEGNRQPLLEKDEIKALNIPRGSLSDEERKEVENHVSCTYEFLKAIPWTKEFSQIPEIAYCHHEKLDGSGYPRKLLAANIPRQARIMTICDIFDALIAADRPYKKALNLEKVISILELEAKGGKLDSRMLRVFIEAQVYKVLNRDNPSLLIKSA